MKNVRIRKAFMITVALSGVILNVAYGTGLLSSFIDPQYNSTLRGILISAIILEFSWAALLLWVVFKPFERRPILLFTIIPILSGNIFHSISQHMDGQGDAGSMALNTVFGLLYAGLYAGAYCLGKPDEEK